MVIAHASLTVADYSHSKDFYTKVLKPLGHYAAFVYDADGHNIEVVWYDYSKVQEKTG